MHPDSPSSRLPAPGRRAVLGAAAASSALAALPGTGAAPPPPPQTPPRRNPPPPSVAIKRERASGQDVAPVANRHSPAERAASLDAQDGWS